jgi:hypothetical protein
MIVWSYTIFLSYQGYANPANFEHGWILALEYVPVYTVLAYELYATRKVKLPVALSD